MTMRHKITAYSAPAKRRVHIFTWTGTPSAGITEAQAEAKRLGVENFFEDYQAEPVEE